MAYVEVAVWFLGDYAIARIYAPIKGQIYEPKRRILEWAEKHKVGGIIVADEIDQHFNWYLRYAVKNMLIAAGVVLDWKETTLNVDFGSYRTMGNLWTPPEK